MSYTINKTDGSVLTEIVDGTIDQTATDLTLIGKNATSYGEFIDENFVHLLENFANTSQPNQPIIGQLWFDTNEGRLKVYDGNGFRVSGGTIVSSSVPSSIAQGDIWIDSLRKQLYFNDGVSTVLAGPIYTEQQGITGLQAIDVYDDAQNSHTILLLYVAKVLIGIFSKDQFTPGTPIPGFSGSITPGFNIGSANSLQFNTAVTSAYNLIDGFGNLKTADSFISNTGDASLTGSVSILNSTPLIIGSALQNEIKVSDSSFQLNSNKSNQNFQIGLKNSNGLLPALFADATNQFVGLYTNTPTATLDVNGDTVIRGSLTVEGNLTTIETNNLVIEDKLIEIGAAETPSNATADGGGILLHAGTDGDKTIEWLASNNSWSSSESINIAIGKTYKINGFDVVTGNALGSTITSAPGLTSIATQTNFQAGNLNITSNAITYVNAISVDGNIVLAPKGAGSVSVSNKKITNVAAPSDDTDAVNYVTLNNAMLSAPLGLSADTTSLPDQQASIASTIINKVFPAAYYLNGTLCRIHCIYGGTRTNKLFTIAAGTWTYTADI